ncbi:MAG: hypothetical protein WDM78_18150 [Puia sp.]
MFYHPVMQVSFRQSIEGALRSSVQVIQGETIVKKLYSAVNQKDIPADLQKQILFSQFPITEVPVSRTGSRTIPNASQHNVPAWTIFAMFFIVLSPRRYDGKGKKQRQFYPFKNDACQLPARLIFKATRLPDRDHPAGRRDICDRK